MNFVGQTPTRFRLRRPPMREWLNYGDTGITAAAGHDHPDGVSRLRTRQVPRQVDGISRREAETERFCCMTTGRILTRSLTMHLEYRQSSGIQTTRRAHRPAWW